MTTDLHQYAAAVSDVNTSQLAQVAELVKQIQAARAGIEGLESMLKKNKAHLAKLEEVDLPSLMDELGLAEITTTDGAKVGLTDTLYASIPQKHKRACAEWLQLNGHGSLVSEEVVATFAKGEEEKAKQAVELLAMSGLGSIRVEETMNTGSIKALIRELTRQGEDVPLALFGAYWKRSVVIK